MRLLVATRNAGKLREFEVLLGDALPAGTQLVGVDAWPTAVPEVVEDGATFVDNALLKAIQTYRATGATTLADDSGLQVDALGGAPGIFSARYAGEHATAAQNNAKLVEALRGVPFEQRTARYVAAVALCLGDDALGDTLRATTNAMAWGYHDGCTVVFGQGTCEGRIIDEARGDGGFGYDPHFWIDDWQQTMAEVSLARKNERSHRADVILRIARFLRITRLT